MIYSDTNNKDNIGYLNIVIWWPPAFDLDLWCYSGRLTENESNKSILAGEQTKKTMKPREPSGNGGQLFDSCTNPKKSKSNK